MTFQHRAGVTPYTSACAFAESCVFGKQSLGPFYCGSISGAPLLPKLRGHFAEFLSYSSLAHLRILSLPMCVHFRYGPMCVVLEAFPGSLLSAFPYLPKLSVCIAPSPCAHRISLVRRYLACPSYSSSWLPEPSPSLHRHTSGTGISTRRPSATPFGLALGPDYPREDEPSSGDLGPSVRGILTHVPLLTPAFSLPCAPHALPVMLLRCMQCSPTTFLSIASVSCLAPVNYRRRVIRLVSCYALFEGWLLLSQPPSCLHVSTSFST